MIDRKKIGNSGEEAAVLFLQKHAYTIIERNYRYSRAEIDIIAQKDNALVFIEVKTRKNALYGYPETFVTEPQQERIHLAAEEYVLQKKWVGDIRFDIMAILWDGRHPVIDHFEDAF